MNARTTRAALIGALASLAALAAAPTASAAVTPVVAGNTLTVTSDQAADTIRLTAAGGFITVNGLDTTLAANENAQIVVNAGDGDDTVDATALASTAYGALTINVGQGADFLTGGVNADLLRGDAGDDRLVGFQGRDGVEGGAGD